MKRINFLQLFIFLLVLIYFVLLGLSVYEIIFPFYKTWFSYTLIFLALMLFPRFIAFGVNTNLWAGCLLLLSGTFGIIRFYLKLSVLFTIAGYLACFGLASLIMFCFFRQIFHLKTFTFILFFAIINFVYGTGDISLLAYIISLVTISAFATFFAVKAIISNTRKV